MRTDDYVTVTAQATDVRFDAVPGHRPAVLDAEFAVDVDRFAAMDDEQLQQQAAELRIVTGVVRAPRRGAGRAP